MGTKVVTGRVRFSYLNILDPRKNDQGRDVWSSAVLIPKTDTKTIDQIKDAIRGEAKAKWGDKIPANLRNPLRDGDEEKPDDEAYALHMWVNANNYQGPPGVVDAQTQAIIDRAELSQWQSGDHGRAHLEFYAYDKSGGGVACGLSNIQFIEHGEPLTGRMRAEDVFEAVAVEEADPFA